MQFLPNTVALFMAKIESFSHLKYVELYIGVGVKL